MDVPRLKYSRHARENMAAYRIDEDDVEAIVWYPARRYVTHRGVEHQGWSWDGRFFTIVTDRSEQLVITVIPEPTPKRTRRFQR
jgi:hypothetical protein